MLSPSRPGWENTNLEPLSPGKRFWSRAITNLPFIILILGSAIPPASLSAEAVMALTTAPFLYLILFYWLFGGHIGHLFMGGRIRDARTGGRISFWQAVVRTSYDLAPLGVVLLVFWTIPMDAEIASGVLDGFIEIASTLAVSIPMGIMVLARESDHRHLFDLLSKTVVVDRATIPTTPDDATPRPARLAEAGKYLLAGVAAIAVLAGLAWLAGFGWFASTPAGEGEPAPVARRVAVPAETPVATAIPTLAARPMPSRFQPGEREYVHALVKEIIADTITDRGEAPPTGDEYMVVCEALRKHRWDPSSFYADPDATTRLGMIVGGMDGMFAEMDKLRLERQWAAYTLNDFCAGIQPASGLGNPGVGRSVSLPAATRSPGAALATSLARITTRQPEPTIIVPSPMPLPTDTPAPTPTATRKPTATPEPWDEYRHAYDSGKTCMNRAVDFIIDRPPTWAVQGFTRCDKVRFESRDGKAEVSVHAERMTNYSSNQATALREIEEDYGVDYTIQDVLGNDLEVEVVTSKRITHRGKDALHQTLRVVPDLRYVYCTTRDTRLVVLAREWSHLPNTRRIYVVTSSVCETNHRHDKTMKRVLNSFRFVGQ